MIFLVTAAEEAGILNNQTTYADIRAALADINWNGGAAWVGPGPRVTRSRVAGTPTKQTFVVWPLDVTDATVQRYGGAAGVKTEVRRAVHDTLVQVDPDTWRSFNVVDYNPAMNGDVAWWRDGSGGASVTHTRDATPDVLGLTHDENPIGPDDARLRPASMADIFDSGSEIAKTIKFASYLVVGAAAIYAVIKTAPAINSFVQRVMTPKKVNPRRMPSRRSTHRLPAPSYGR